MFIYKSTAYRDYYIPQQYAVDIIRIIIIISNRYNYNGL